MIFAGESPQIPSLKTGWELGKSEHDYAIDRVEKMSREDKEQLEYLQLKEILPEVIHQQLPWYVLKEVGFSLTDDNLSRSQKYIRLAQLTKVYGQDNNYTRKWIRQHVELETLDEETINQVTYESYRSAFESLKALEPMVLGFEKLDYYTSLAQIELWTAHALLAYDDSKLESAVGLLFECFRSLKDAEEALKEFPSGADVMEKIQTLNRVLERSLIQIPDNQLKEMAVDATTKLSLADENDLENIHYEIVEKQVENAKKSLSGRNDLSETIKQQTIENFRALKLEKVAHIVGIKSRQEKLKIILAQRPQDNWVSLMRLGYAHASDNEIVEKNDLLAYASLIDKYAFGIGRDHRNLNAEKIDSIRDRFARKLEDLGVTISRHLQEVKDVFAATQQ